MVNYDDDDCNAKVWVFQRPFVFSPYRPFGVSAATEENLVTNQLAHLDDDGVDCDDGGGCDDDGGCDDGGGCDCDHHHHEEMEDVTHGASPRNSQLHLFGGDLGVANLPD